jgi:hypothetical protein
MTKTVGVQVQSDFDEELCDDKMRKVFGSSDEKVTYRGSVQYISSS